MLIAELTAPHQFRLSDKPIEDPGPGEVQVRADAVGICGSDLHSYTEGSVGDTPCEYPMVLGHEPAGTVVKIGAGVTGWSVGARAALEPAHYCYHCEFCLSGRHNLCANIRFLSAAGIPGFFREFVNLPLTNVLAIPKEISLEVATLIEPLAIIIHSMKIAALRFGESVIVYGGGPIGLLTIACLKIVGAKRILAVEPVAHRREMAKQMGADAALEPEEADALGNNHVDFAIDCAAKEHTTNQAIRAVRNGGRVLITGIHSATHVPFEVSPMRRKELAIFFVRRSNHDSEAAIDLLTERLSFFAPLVTHTRPIEKIAEAFSIAENYSDGVGKIVVTAKPK